MGRRVYPGVLILVAAGLLIMPGHGLMSPALWLGPPHLPWIILMAVLIFVAVYFGVLTFWKLLTGDDLPKPLPAVLALFLAVRLIVDCARMMMWR